MNTAGKAPMPAVCPAGAAPVVLILLRRAFLDNLPKVTREELAEFDRRLAFVTGWQQEWQAELGGTGPYVDVSPEGLATEVAAESRATEISTKEAAMRLRVSDHRVRQLCQEGRLDYRTVAGRYLIDAQSVDLRAAGVA